MTPTDLVALAVVILGGTASYLLLAWITTWLDRRR